MSKYTTSKHKWITSKEEEISNENRHQRKTKMPNKQQTLPIALQKLIPTLT